LELSAKDPESAFRIPDRKGEEIIAGAYHRARFDQVMTLNRRTGSGSDLAGTQNSTE